MQSLVCYPRFKPVDLVTRSARYCVTHHYLYHAPPPPPDVVQRTELKLEELLGNFAHVNTKLLLKSIKIKMTVKPNIS